jgi:hypothetical protein
MASQHGTTEVRLSLGEWTAAESTGRKRESLRLDRGLSPPEYNDAGGSHMDRNALGSVAEYALAKLLGPDTLRDWCENKAFSLNHRDIPCDVGQNLHVRATTLAHGGLIVHPYDPPNGVFVLAVVDRSRLLVRYLGWWYARSAQTPRYWRNTGPGFGLRPAYVVPQDHLHPMDTLPEDAIRCLPSPSSCSVSSDMPTAV